MFVPFQCIKTFGATKWTAITGKIFLCNIFQYGISNNNKNNSFSFASIFFEDFLDYL